MRGGRVAGSLSWRPVEAVGGRRECAGGGVPDVGTPQPRGVLVVRVIICNPSVASTLRPGGHRVTPTPQAAFNFVDLRG